MEEIWKPIPLDELGGKYEASNLGRVRRASHITPSRNGIGAHERHYRSRMVKGIPSHFGYPRVKLTLTDKRQKSYTVHRLVAITFLPNPKHLPVVDHVDTNPSNNVVSNLRWCTHSENNLNPITRARSSAARMGNKYGLGWHPNEEQKLKHHNALLGRKVSQETREKLRLANTGRKFTEEHRLKLGKPVGQFSLQGELIKTYPSATDAAKSIGITRAAITNCANPKDYHKTAGGFIWKFV